MRLRFDYGDIRDWAREDIADLVEFANNPKVARNMFDGFPHPYTEADAHRWLEGLAGTPTPTHWAIEVNGRAAGGIGIGVEEGATGKSAEFGYWLGEPYWGRGIATGAVRALAPYVMSRFGLVRLEAHVFQWNPASMRVLEKAGFERECVLPASAFKDGVLVDRVLYSYDVEEHGETV